MSRKTYKLKSSGPKKFHLNYENDLNQEQLQIVKEAEGPCLILAGAGSGKTRTLVYRVAYLLEKGVKPEQILLMTFTNKAAKEMLWRVEHLLGYKPQGLWGGTFHHIGNMILRKYINKLGWKNNYSILDEQDAQDILRLIIGQKNLQKNKYFPKARVVKNIISFSLNADIKIKQTINEYFSYLQESIIPDLEEIARLYQAKKKSINALDYDDLLILWLKLLESDQDLQKNLAKKFQYILVDEYQDTNHLQASLVKILSQHHLNILVVGDDAQSIYSFRAADVENILSFPANIKNTTIYKLETNYRSSPEILSLANQSIKNNKNQFTKKLKAIKPSNQKPILANLQNSEQQAQFICQRIIELTEEGYKLRDIAVLFRADFHALELELELNKKSIPYIKRGGIKFFEQAHLKDIVAFLKIKYNSNDEVAWTRVLNLQSGIGRVGAQKIINAISKTDLSLALQGKQTFPALLQKAWHNFKPVLEKIDSLPDTNIPELIQVVLSEFYQLYAETNFDNASKRLDDIEQLMSFAGRYDSLESFLSDISLSENFRADTPAASPDNPDDLLVISTIHQAKGLEWPIVFVINLTNGQFPHSKSLDSDQEVEEERRLFYVAVTRAESQLYLTYPAVLYNQQYGFIFSQPSDFIQELEENLYDIWEIDNSDLDLPSISYD